MPKFVFVSGGVISGLGKGVVTASIGRILKARRYSVTAIKIDPYINVDAGTLRPTEHGEVWVTEDGGEIDQDLGHYERFLDMDIPKKNNITTGQVYLKVIQDERAGKYLGKTVQLIPHITDEVIRRIREAGDGYDIVLVEIGGTVGDIENIPFLIAAKKLELTEGRENVCHILVTYLPVPGFLGEMKTKPTQHAIKALGEHGIIPDFIVCRSEHPVDEVRKRKIYVYANIPPDNVISDPDVEFVYEIPLIFEEQKLGEKLLKRLGLEQREPDLREWRRLVERLKSPIDSVKIAIVGKYVSIGAYRLPDSYISIAEALKHASAHLGVRAEVEWVNSLELEKKPPEEALSGCHGVIVPGGFGSTGVEGKIAAIRWARETLTPYLGLCFGLQLAVVEYARNVCGLEGAHTTEIDPDTPHPVVDILPEQRKLIEEEKYGGTMRLGSYPAVLRPGTLVHKLYGRDVVYERHRHRYEVNPEYHGVLQEHGLVFSGMSPDGRLVEFIELPEHPFFVGTQAHPEFKSRFLKPHPLFKGFLEAAHRRKVGRSMR